MADIVITEFMDESAVRSLSDRAAVLYEPDLVDRPEALRAALGDCRALIVRNRTQVRPDLLEAGHRLQVVGRLGVGLDNIDLGACAARGITVHPATGANDDAVAEYVACCALMLLRGAFLGTAAVATGGWPRDRMIGREVAGKRAGLIGFGGTARKAGARLAALGMQISATDPHLAPNHPAWRDAERLSFREVLKQSDVISVHVPLTPETRHMLDRDALGLMKRDAVLINAARGGVVDEKAVAEALRAKRLGGAALDVFECEPLDAHGGTAFDGVPNLILTPHIAGVTAESNVRVSGMIAEIVLRELKLR